MSVSDRDLPLGAVRSGTERARSRLRRKCVACGLAFKCQGVDRKGFPVFDRQGNDVGVWALRNLSQRAFRLRLFRTWPTGSASLQSENFSYSVPISSLLIQI